MVENFELLLQFLVLANGSLLYVFLHQHHKLKRRVELNERKILEILKNHFRQYSQLHTSYNDLNNNYLSTYNSRKLLSCIIVFM